MGEVTCSLPAPVQSIQWTAAQSNEILASATGVKSLSLDYTLPEYGLPFFLCRATDIGFDESQRAPSQGKYIPTVAVALHICMLRGIDLYYKKTQQAEGWPYNRSGFHCTYVYNNNDVVIIVVAIVCLYRFN